jgi:hypothetical protein
MTDSEMGSVLTCPDAHHPIIAGTTLKAVSDGSFAAILPVRFSAPTP